MVDAKFDLVLRGYTSVKLSKNLFFFGLFDSALLRIFCENFKVVFVIFFEWQSFKEELLASVKSIGKSLNAFFSK